MSAVTTQPHLVMTERAAAAVDVDPDRFRAWAADRGLKAARHIRLGRSSYAVWDLDEVYAAEQGGTVRSVDDKKPARP